MAWRGTKEKGHIVPFFNTIDHPGEQPSSLKPVPILRPYLPRMPYFEFWGGKQAKDRIDSNVLTRGTNRVIQVSRGDKGFATANHT